VHAHKGGERPLQFGTGGVEQRPEAAGVPHLQLEGVSRQNVTDSQEGLTWKIERMLDKKTEKVKCAMIF